MLAAGYTSSFCTSVGGQLFGWGKLKSSGDNTMYPQPMYDLQVGLGCGGEGGTVLYCLGVQ